MVSITPFLWFDKEAFDAAHFYTSIFSDSSIKTTEKLNDTPSGDVQILSLDIHGKAYSLMNAGPFHKFNPSISFVFNTNNSEVAKSTWDKLSNQGTELMGYAEYPFAEMFGWVQDKFGLSWQVQLNSKTDEEKIIPNLMFVGKACGKAEEALHFYTSVFKNSKIGEIKRYSDSEKPEKPGNIKHALFAIENSEFSINESANDHKFFFNESMSFVINCKNQKEINYYWDKLSAEPKAEQCGWLKDKFGVSWQVVPTSLSELMSNPDKNKVTKMREALLKMKKIDLLKLQSFS